MRVLDYPGLLAQPDARLGSALHRRIVSGFGQHEVLDARQLVHDLAIVIHQLDAVFEMASHRPILRVEQRGNGSLRAITPLVQAHEPETVQVRLRIKGTTIVRVHDDAAEKRNPKWEAYN